MGDITIYCANPIAGRPNQNIEYARFMGTLVEAMGAVPIVPQDIEPSEHVGDCPEGYAFNEASGHSSGCHMRDDLKALLDCNAVLFATDWEKSVGCKFEMDVARLVGMPIMYITPDGTVRDAKTGEDVLSV